MRPSSDLLSNLSALQQAALDWHTRRNSPEWTLDDEQALTAWLVADTAHRDAFARWQRHEQRLAALPPKAIAHLKGRLVIDKARLSALPQFQGTPPAEPERQKPRPARLAAAALACLVAGLGIAWHHQYASPVFSQSYMTAKGELMDVALPDGSTLQLDTATEVAVNFYRGQREVWLKAGQAMFSVSPGESRPFLVAAGDTRVTVVGTRFSVRHTPELRGHDRVQVAVEKGRVRVSRRPQGLNQWLPANYYTPAGAEMARGQQLTALASGAPGAIGTIESEAIAPWREHRLNFVNTPLGQAIDELNRYTETGLILHDPGVAALRISGSFDTRNVDSLRRVLPRALPVRLVSRGSKTEIIGTR